MKGDSAIAAVLGAMIGGFLLAMLGYGNAALGAFSGAAIVSVYDYYQRHVATGWERQ